MTDKEFGEGCNIKSADSHIVKAMQELEGIVDDYTWRLLDEARTQLSQLKKFSREAQTPDQR